MAFPSTICTTGYQAILSSPALILSSATSPSKSDRVQTGRGHVRAGPALTGEDEVAKRGGQKYGEACHLTRGREHENKLFSTPKGITFSTRRWRVRVGTESHSFQREEPRALETEKKKNEGSDSVACQSFRHRPQFGPTKRRRTSTERNVWAVLKQIVKIVFWKKRRWFTGKSGRVYNNV